MNEWEKHCRAAYRLESINEDDFIYFLDLLKQIIMDEEVKKYVEDAVDFVNTIHNLKTFYRTANDPLDVGRIQRTEKNILERYPRFRDIHSVEDFYDGLLLDAHMFYKSKFVKKMKMPVPVFVQEFRKELENVE